MRLKLQLKIPDANAGVLPVNYQYEFSAWIYHTLYFGNPEFSTWLHQKGYEINGRRFKLFTFSNIVAERFKVTGDRFRILSDEASIVLTFRIDEAVLHFISGLFRRQQFSIGDTQSRVDFEVKTVETLPPPTFQEKMHFRALSPLCITRPEDKNGKLRAEYLSPDHPEYERRFFENLVTRYKAAYSKVNGSTSAKVAKDGLDQIGDFQLKVVSKPKSRLVKIKADTPQETQIRGFIYNFECTAPAELLKFGYEAGFAEKNALGFGCVEVDALFLKGNRYGRL